MSRLLRYVTHKDIDLIIELLTVAKQNTNGMHSGQVITPSINRMLLELDDFKKRDMDDIIK